MSQKPLPPVPSSNASQGSAASGRSNGPTISIENVELLEADRQHGGKRSRRGSRQQEAADAAAAAGGEVAPLLHAPGPYGYPGYDPSQSYPQDPSNYYYPNYGQGGGGGGQAPPNYGIPPYQGGYQQPGAGYYPGHQGSGYGSPYGYPPHPQQQQPSIQQQPGAPGATEYTNILSSGSPSGFDGGYGSLGGGGQAGYPPPAPSGVSGNRAMGALTMDDIEKSFNNVVTQHYPDPTPPPPPPPLLAKPPVAEPKQKPPSVPSSPRPPPTHRRTSSNASASSRNSKNRHRRTGSAGNLPPAGPSGRSPAPNPANRKQPDQPPRRRTLSASGSIGGASRGSHRRGGSFSRSASNNDLQSVGGGSVCSHHSIVSDISKSALFQGVTDEGHVQLHFPYEAVRLVNNRDMERGTLYMQEIHPREYENYHVAAEEISGWEHGLDHENRFKGLECTCTCNNCNSCSGKKELLPRLYYALKVDDDIYRRVLDEISSSRMPCGLFFCGHHEDVSYPSVQIAVGMLIVLFALMGYVAFVFHF